MTKEELQKEILHKVAYTHGGVTSYYYIRIRDKIMKFSDVVWDDLIKKYVNEKNEIDMQRVMKSVRTRKIK